MKFMSYKCEFVGKVNEIHILINEKSNREIPGFFKIEPGSREWNPTVCLSKATVPAKSATNHYNVRRERCLVNIINCERLKSN